MKAPWLVGLFFALPFAGWAQAGETPVSMTLRGARLEQLIPAMGRQMNRDLRVQDTLRDRVGLIRVTNLPASELMKAVEAAFDANWVDMGGYTILTRDGAREEALRRADLATETENIRKQLEKALAKPFNPQTMTDAVKAAIKLEQEDEEDESYWQRQQQLSGSSPAFRAAREFMQLIGPATLAALPDEARVVYASRPTAWQRPLPAWGAAWIARLNERTAMWRDAVNAVNAEQNAENPWQSELLRPPMPNRMATADVIVVVTKSVGAISISINGYTAQGQRSVSGNSFLQTNTETDLSELDFNVFRQEMSEDLGTLTLSPQDQKESQILQSMIGFTEANPVSRQERLAKVQTWLERDPASGTVTDLILAHAQAKKRPQLVAAIPDYALLMIRADIMGPPRSSEPQESQPLPISNLNMAFHPAWGMWNVQTVGGATVYRLGGGQALAFQLDRRKAVQIAERLRQKPVLAFEDLAEFVADTPTNHLADPVLRMALNLSGQSAESQYYGGDRTSLLRLYGRMNANERRAARNGGLEVALNGLRAPLRAVVEEMLFKGNAWIEATVGPGSSQRGFYSPVAMTEESAESMSQEQMRAFQQRMMEFQQKFYDGKYSEITYLMATREAQPILVNLEIKREDVMVAFDPTAQWGNMLRGQVREIADEVAQWEAYARAMPSEPMYRRNYQQFGTGQRETFTVNVTFGKPAGPAKRDTMYGRMNQQIDIMASGEPQMGAYEALPEALRKEYEARLVEARKMYENMQFSPPRGGRRIRP